MASISRACSNKELARLIKQVIKQGTPYRRTKSGLIFYGKDGKTVGLHFSTSDRRAYDNLRKELTRAGIIE